MSAPTWRRVIRVLTYALAILMALWVLIPIYLIGVAAFSPQLDVYKFPRPLFPNPFSTETMAFFLRSGGVIASVRSSVIVAVIILAFQRGGQLGGWSQVPWYALCAGFLGLIILAAINVTIPRLGAAATTTLIVVAQLVMSAVIDHFGWLEVSARPLTLARFAGVAFLVFGAWLMIRE